MAKVYSYVLGDGSSHGHPALTFDNAVGQFQMPLGRDMDPQQPPTAVSCVAGQFPADLALLSKLVAEDEGFSTLCDDFALTIETLQKLEGASAEDGEVAARKAEYRMLARELKQEIASILEKYRK